MYFALAFPKDASKDVRPIWLKEHTRSAELESRIFYVSEKNSIKSLVYTSLK